MGIAARESTEGLPAVGGEADAGIARTGEGGGDDLEEVGAPPLPPPMARQEVKPSLVVAASPCVFIVRPFQQGVEGYYT